MMNTMGYKGTATRPGLVKRDSDREVFNPKDIVMPKMEIRNAPNHNVWGGGKH